MFTEKQISLVISKTKKKVTILSKEIDILITKGRRCGGGGLLNPINPPFIHNCIARSCKTVNQFMPGELRRSMILLKLALELKMNSKNT